MIFNSKAIKESKIYFEKCKLKYSKLVAYQEF